VGSISATGLYAAPGEISALQGVYVVATSTVVNFLFGVGLVILAPAQA
jgi:hypothetical protein